MPQGEREPMINFSARVQALQDRRDRATRELDGSRTVLRDEAMRERRDQVESDYRVGLDALASDYSQAEAALNTAAAAARYRAWVASIGGADNVSRALPGMTGAQLSETYRGAIAAQDQAAQISIELFRPSFAEDDRTANGALLEINTLRQAQQSARSQKESAALASIEAERRALAGAYASAIAPVIADRAKGQAADRGPQF